MDAGLRRHGRGFTYEGNREMLKMKLSDCRVSRLGISEMRKYGARLYQQRFGEMMLSVQFYYLSA